MEKYSKKQRISIVKTHYQHGESFAVTVRKLHTSFGHHNSPNESTDYRLIKTFEENGSSQDIKSTRRFRNGRSEANVIVVRDLLP